VCRLAEGWCAGCKNYHYTFGTPPHINTSFGPAGRLQRVFTCFNSGCTTLKSICGNGLKLFIYLYFWHNNASKTSRQGLNCTFAHAFVLNHALR